MLRNAETLEVIKPGPYPKDVEKRFGKLGRTPTFQSLPTLAGHTAKVSAIDCGSTHLRLRED